MPSVRHPTYTLLQDILFSISRLATQCPVAPRLPPDPFFSASPRFKALFLTLHCLFPNEFLPALDVLDRNLVTELKVLDPLSNQRYATSRDANVLTQSRNLGATGNGVVGLKLYYVRSSQASRSGGRFKQAIDLPAILYEVRLRAWNCSCPAFAFAAFSGMESIEAGGQGGGNGNRGKRGAGQDAGHQQSSDGYENARGAGNSLWASDLRNWHGKVPMCKHLLACLLVEECGLFQHGPEVSVISIDGAVGWQAGWA